jgi:hypothetical protein
MKVVEANIGNWAVQCIPEDGARISVLRYEGQDLLTANPAFFKAPEHFYGEYETRPVYGYDDCFPTVDSCVFQVESIEYKDHGELCWLTWKVKIEESSMICSLDCLHPKVTFRRILEFDGNKLRWRFELENTSDKYLVFLHVMHALLPLNQIQSIKLPEFAKCFDDINLVEPALKNAVQMAGHLLEIQPGSYEMLLLNEIDSGTVKIGLQNSINLLMSFDNKLFPTLGIWWNNAGYPDEAGLRRSECAFEPIPGTCSNLVHSADDGVCFSVEAGKSMNWEIIWEISKN